MKRIRSRPLLVALAAVVTLLVLAVVVPRLASHQTAAPSATSLPSEEPPGHEGGSQEGEEKGEDPDAGHRDRPGGRRALRACHQGRHPPRRARPGGGPSIRGGRPDPCRGPRAGRRIVVLRRSDEHRRPGHGPGRRPVTSPTPSTPPPPRVACGRAPTPGQHVHSLAGRHLPGHRRDRDHPRGHPLRRDRRGQPRRRQHHYGGRGVYRSTDRGVAWQSAATDRHQPDRPDRWSTPPIRTGSWSRPRATSTTPAATVASTAPPTAAPPGRRSSPAPTPPPAPWTSPSTRPTPTASRRDVGPHARSPTPPDYGGVGSGAVPFDQRRRPPGTRLGQRGCRRGRSPTSAGWASRSPRATPTRVYAIAANTTGNFLGFYDSTNGGDSWTKITNTSALAGSQSTFGWWFARIWVDPVGPSTLSSPPACT